MSQENSKEPKKLKEIIEKEIEFIEQSRQQYHPEDQGKPPFGIALSGGGIRSATLNLGVMEVLNACQILKRADYLSSVSGGGYIAGYVHAHLNKYRENAYAGMFLTEQIAKLKDYGYYLTPGQNRWERFWSKLRMGGALVISFLMNLIWVVALVGVLIFGIKFFYYALFNSPYFQAGLKCVLIGTIVILAYYFFCHGLRRIRLWNSDYLYYAAGFLLLLLMFWAGLSLAEKKGQFPNFEEVNEVLKTYSFGYLHLPKWVAWPSDESGRTGLLLSSIILFVTGFFANPNLLTLHRFYRDRLRKAYLQDAGTGDEGLKLAEIRPKTGTGYWGPYPLINTCLNLFNANDENFPGTKGSDYFVFSPLFCGSERIGYLDTQNELYQNRTLATVVAVSGAAVNPHMGTQSKSPVAFLLTLLNLRLGYWEFAPKAYPWFRWLTWWPYYHILELLSWNDTNRWRVNLSDGGHIENLGVYELLRRGCRLIIAVDAAADRKYAFNDLKNLVIRARNELGLEIKFQQDPETFIRPMPSKGFSRSHYVTARITNLDKEDPLYKDHDGLLIYLKASMRLPLLAPRCQKEKESKAYKYKTYHPDFPHESTANQFFDE